MTKQLQDTLNLILEATEGVADIVQTMQQRIGSGPEVLGKPFKPIVKIFTAPSYLVLRAVTHMIARGVDAILSPIEKVLPTEGLERGAILAALNGVLGDRLQASHSSLAIRMQLCFENEVLRLEPSEIRARCQPSERLLILLHGSSVDETIWDRGVHNYGKGLAADCGYLPLFLRYNSGLHISENGAHLVGLLDELWRAWPWPIRELAFLGHSMGGLVALSALLQAEQRVSPWRSASRILVTLGSPYHGSPLERGGNWIDAALQGHSITEPLSQLGKIRSAGVTDLRFGAILEEHWQGRDRFAFAPDPRKKLVLPQDVSVYAVAATSSSPHVKHYASDGLVQVRSALGKHERPELCLPIPEERQRVITKTSHLGLLSHPEVYDILKLWFSSTAGAEQGHEPTTASP